MRDCCIWPFSSLTPLWLPSLLLLLRRLLCWRYTTDTSSRARSDKHWCDSEQYHENGYSWQAYVTMHTSSGAFYLLLYCLTTHRPAQGFVLRVVFNNANSNCHVVIIIIITCHFLWFTVYIPLCQSVFHPSGVGKWVPASAAKAEAGVVQRAD